MIIKNFIGSDKIRNLKEIQELFANKGYCLLSKEYSGNKEPLIFEKNGYLYKSTYNGFIKTDSPKKWGVNNPFSIYNLKKYLKEDKATCKVLSTNYDSHKIKLQCQCGKEYEVTWNNLLKNKQYMCPDCGRKKSAQNHRIDDKYLPMLDKYGLILCEEYRGSKYYHLVKTNEGYITKVQLHSLLKGINLYNFIFNVNNPYSLHNIKIWLSIHGNGLKIISDNYYGSKKRYKFKCSCGEEFETTWEYVYLNHITRCPKCSHRISKLELKTKEWLDEYNIEYQKEKTFSDCVYIYPLRFDFYLPKLKKIIEVDGEQHFKPSGFGESNQEKVLENFATIKIRDNIKDKYCKVHNIPLLRIPYTAFNTNKYKQLLLSFTTKI